MLNDNKLSVKLYFCQVIINKTINKNCPQSTGMQHYLLVIMFTLEVRIS